MMVKRIPRPPGRRRSPPTPLGVSATTTAIDEAVVGPTDQPEPNAAALGSPDTATSAQALLSSHVALDSAIDVTGTEEAPPASGTSPLTAEPALVESAPPPQNLDVVVSPAVAELEPPPPPQDLDVVVGPALAALQPPPFFEDVPIVLTAQPHKATPFVPTDLAAAGATFQAFLLNEGLAAFVHWRALTQAPSPADALRLHVDEMQRAADASITCLSRMVGHLGRIGATKVV